MGPLQRAQAQAQTKPNIVSQAAPSRRDQLPTRKPIFLTGWPGLAGMPDLGSGLSDATLAVHTLAPFFPPPQLLKGWTAETSTRAAKPETQIDGHARPDPRGALIVDACIVRVGGLEVGEGRGGRGWWRRSSVIQPHDANHDLFSALWTQCTVHYGTLCIHSTPDCSVFFLSDKRAGLVATIPAGRFLPRTISHKSLAPWRSHRWLNAHTPSHEKRGWVF